ncbi:spermidine synthase [Streptomyces sp. MST-110588]|uniref:spermidine synthase n=1 Tax=Streptomyces sp. MST-110588 TaxID=2833628 RepID=UPI001F5CD8AE|nr:spermidine synthase [Streptomyces sp. MST-110588]UNO41136.1 spermidine synthase [Streptomyces sp. MST-110588]
MIDPPEPASPEAPGPPEALKPARLPVSAGLGRLLVLTVVFLCAACGLVYELELVALASYLAGDSVTQASVVLSVMVFAMGVGSLLAKRLRCRAAVGFGAVEALLALIGGYSAMALYACFAWLAQSRSVLVGFSLAIGVLIGAEVPLLMTLIQRVRRQDPGGAVADLFAADYVGALVGGLAFPFLLLPVLGQLTGALLTGTVNAVAGGALVLWLFGRDLTVRSRWLLIVANVLVLALLAVGTALAAPFERAARQAVYGAAARVALRTGVQEVVITDGVADAGAGGAQEGSGGGAGDGAAGAGGGTDGDRTDSTSGTGGAGGAGQGQGGAGAGSGGRDAAAPGGQQGADGPGRTGRGGGRPLALYLDGRLRASSDNEFRYHEALVHPAMAGHPRRRVLVLGGGDGLAAREVLRYRDVRSVTVIELDPDVTRLARTDPGLSALNHHALRDRRVRVVTGDAFDWLRRRAPAEVRRRGAYDVVICDLPDPGGTASTKLYSQEFYGLTARVLAKQGRVVVHAGRPGARPGSFWTVDATLRSVPFATVPYGVPGGGIGFLSWGFLLAARRPPPLVLAPDAPPLRSLNPGILRAAGRALASARPPGLAPSTLMRPRYLG